MAGNFQESSENWETPLLITLSLINASRSFPVIIHPWAPQNLGIFTLFAPTKLPQNRQNPIQESLRKNPSLGEDKVQHLLVVPRPLRPLNSSKTPPRKRRHISIPNGEAEGSRGKTRWEMEAADGIWEVWISSCSVISALAEWGNAGGNLCLVQCGASASQARNFNFE